MPLDCIFQGVSLYFVKLIYFSEEASLTPEQISSVHFRHSLVAAWQQFSSAHPNANISSNLKFGNAYDGFKQSTEFENLIVLLKDVSSVCGCQNELKLKHVFVLD